MCVLSLIGKPRSNVEIDFRDAIGKVVTSTVCHPGTHGLTQ